MYEISFQNLSNFWENNRVVHALEPAYDARQSRSRQLSARGSFLQENNRSPPVSADDTNEDKTPTYTQSQGRLGRDCSDGSRDTHGSWSRIAHPTNQNPPYKRHPPHETSEKHAAHSTTKPNPPRSLFPTVPSHLNSPRQQSIRSSEHSFRSRPGHVTIMRQTRDTSRELSTAVRASEPSWRKSRKQTKTPRGTCVNETGA